MLQDIQNKKRKPKQFYMICGLVILLVAIGLMMVYSASHVWALEHYQDAFFFVKRQALFACLGMVCMLIIAHIPYSFFRKYTYVILLACFILLLLVLIPGIGLVRGGARSWIGIGIFSIQPAEFMKLGIILFLASYFSQLKKTEQSFMRRFLLPLMLVFIAFGLIMLQPDFGTAVVLVGTAMIIVFIAGARWVYFLYFSFIGLFGIVFLIISAPYRLKRITSFFNPWEDPLGDGFQIIQSLYAIGPGQLLGVGFGHSMQKFFYLPEPQTDFIFSIFAEEFGLIGAICLLFIFFFLFKNSMNIALRTSDPFARYLVFGIITMITIQVCMNISVVIGLIPVTGITLPFLSYGGSSLMLLLSSIGIVLNISFYAERLQLDYN